MHIEFRLGARVALSPEELKTIVDGDSTPIVKALEEGRVTIGDGIDSYIPQPWLEENEEVPEELSKDDVCLDIPDSYQLGRAL